MVTLIRNGDVIIGIESNPTIVIYSLSKDMLWRHKIFLDERHGVVVELKNFYPTTIYDPVVNNLLDEVPILGMA